MDCNTCAAGDMGIRSAAPAAFGALLIVLNFSTCAAGDGGTRTTGPVCGRALTGGGATPAEPFLAELLFELDGDFCTGEGLGLTDNETFFTESLLLGDFCTDPLGLEDGELICTSDRAGGDSSR